MANLDAALRGVSANLMKTFGTTVTVRRIESGKHSTSTGPATTPFDTEVKGILENFNAREIGQGVKVGDRKLTIAASDLTFEPDPDDKVLIGAKLYRIVGPAESIRATDEAALYVMQLRGNV